MIITPPLRFVGIDVSQADLVVAIDGDDQIKTYPNTAPGRARLCETLTSLKAHARVLLEATGGYEWPLWETLVAAGFDARQVAPAQVAALRIALGNPAKTDLLDARLIARYGHVHPQAGRRLPLESIRRIKALVTARRQRRGARTKLIQQTKRCANAEVAALDEAMLALLDAQIAELDTRIETAIAADQRLAGRAALLRSIPGFGPTTVAVLLAEIPELGDLTEKTAPALTGLAPIARDSGKYAGKRFIGGGRKTVRDALYMAATVAARHNHDQKETFQRHRANGMPYKKAITAIARKLIILANTVLKRQTPWCPNPK